jgi:hypothetical protein
MAKLRYPAPFLWLVHPEFIDIPKNGQHFPKIVG